jgi:hypothetical protein
MPSELEALKENLTPTRQKGLEAARKHYRLVPPTIQQAIESPSYFDLDRQACSAVKRTLYELFAPGGSYHEAALYWGIGAGKSFLCSVALAYMIYRTLCLRDPQAYYGLAPGSQIVFTNFSVNATQAERVVFSELARRIDHAPCFQGPGFQRDRKLQSELRWTEQNVVAFPGNSRETSALGYNVLGAVVDEASWLEVVERSLRQAGRTRQGQYDAAEELYYTLSERMLSRGNLNWQRHSLFLLISSPRYVGDFIARKMREAEVNSTVYASRLPSWEGAPAARLSGVTFSHPLCGEVPIEYQEQFLRDPDRAARDLGAVPSEAIGGYLSASVVLAAVDLGRSVEHTIADIDSLPSWLVPVPTAAYYLHVDLGLKRDAAGVGMAHCELGGSVVVDYAWRLTAEQYGGEVDFEAIRQLVLDLRQAGFSIRQVTYDGWQSADSLQQLRRAGFQAEVFSVDRDLEAYDTFKELLHTNRVSLPDFSPLIQELCQLELIQGKKVDHPPRGSKDVADGVAGAVFAALIGRSVSGFSMVVDGVDLVEAPSLEAKEEAPGGYRVVPVPGVLAPDLTPVEQVDWLRQKIRTARGER